MRRAGILLSVAALLAIGWASLRTSPYLGDSFFIPRTLARWADRHPDSRHFVGYLFVSALIAWTFRADAGWKRAACIMIALCAFAASTEVVQAFMRFRNADPKDVLWSWLGISVASVVPLIRGLARAKLAKRRQKSAFDTNGH